MSLMLINRFTITGISRTCRHFSYSQSPSVNNTGPTIAPFIPSKIKEDIISLHASEPTTWTSSKLAEKYRVPEANVNALLRLSSLRPKEGDKVKEKLDRIGKTWQNLTEPFPRSRGLAEGDPLMPDFGPAFQQIDESKVAEAGHEENEPMGDSEDTTTTNVVKDIEEESVALNRDVMSTTAQWIEQIENDPAQVKDHVRRTTFVFTEVGKGLTNQERAVWIREGATGKLRSASLEERKVYLKGKT